MFKAINPETVVKPISNYENGLLVPAAPTLFISGQVGVDAQFHFPEGIEAQTRLTFENIRQIVTAAGGTMRNIVSITLFLKDIADARVVGAIRSEVFGDPPFPTSTMIGNATFVMPQILVEISAVATFPDGF